MKIEAESVCAIGSLRLSAEGGLWLLEAQNAFDVILAVEILRKGTGNFFKARVPVRHKRSHLNCS